MKAQTNFDIGGHAVDVNQAELAFQLLHELGRPDSAIRSGAGYRCSLGENHLMEAGEELLGYSARGWLSEYCLDVGESVR